MPRGQPPYHASNPPERIHRPTRSRSVAAVSEETADSNAAPTPATNKKKKNPDRVKNSLIAVQIAPPLYKFMLEIKWEKSPLKRYQPWLLVREQQRQIAGRTP
jgi:hypothetical protein